jgi:hypothetical protein
MRGNGPYLDWTNRARRVPIADVIHRRGIKLGRVGDELIGPCPKCGGTDRFAVHIKKQQWNCRQCKKETDVGDVIGFVMWHDGCDFNAACATLAGPQRKANGKHHAGHTEIVAAEYQYHDQDSATVLVVERIEFQKLDGDFVLKDGKRDKTFRQKRPDPNNRGKWLYNAKGAARVPYRLPELVEAIANNRPIFIAEGEAKADLLWSWNFAATCCVGGAKKWKPEHSEFLRGANVFLLPDNDGPGWEHVNRVGAALATIASSIRVVALPGLPEKGDIVDWAKVGGTREQLDALIDKAPDWAPPVEKIAVELEKKDRAAQSEDELLAALARMPKGVEFGRERKRLAEKLDVRGSDIDAEIEARQIEAETEALLHGHWYVEPWPEPVDGDALIRDIIRKLQKHVALSFENALMIALWIMLAWVHDEVAIHSPILVVSSAEPGSGKSTILAIISFLVPRAISTVDISRGALYRAINRWQPSFVIDEFDTVLAAQGGNDKAELRSVINSGHTRGQGVLRCVTDDHTPEVFPTFAPKALGMVGRKMPATTLSRCVVAELHRAKTDEQDKKFKHKDDGELAELRSRLRRFSMDSVNALRDAKPSMPDRFENRRADNWRLQFAIADLCSGAEDWGDKARAAAVKVESSSDSRTMTAQLIAAIKDVFDSTGDDAVGSQELCDGLAADPGSEWAEWGKSRKPITQHQLARMLKAHRIYPDQVRPKAHGGKQVRGYHRSWFEDAWSRYL